MEKRKHKFTKVSRFFAKNRQKIVIVGLVLFAVTGTVLLNNSRAAIGACSESGLIGSSTYTVSVPATDQYRVWARIQTPDTTNTGNTNGVSIEVDGNQCFIMTTTSNSAVNQWMWVNSSAAAPSTPHISATLSAGNHTVRVIGAKDNVKLDSMLFLTDDNTCTPSNDFSNGSPGDNCTTPAPAITFSASPTTITSGSSSTLTWSATNATGCVASGAWTGSRSSSGNTSTGNLTSDRTYTLTCTGAGGSTVRNVTVTVTTPAPTVNFSASPSTIATGAASTLTWSSSNATSCTASGAWSGSRATSGSASTGNLTSNQTYTLSCTGAGGTTNRNVTVTVQTSSAAPVVSMDFTNVTPAAGSTTITVNNLPSVTWRPIVTTTGTIQSVVYRVNGSVVNLTNGTYAVGASANGDFALQVQATDTNNQTTTSNFTVRVRYPDFNRNGTVTILDVSMLLSQWNSTTDVRYDINTNGRVDLFDLSFVLSRWGS